MRFRFTVRKMMAATALAALAMVAAGWVAALRKQSSNYQTRAKIHDLSRKVALAVADTSAPGVERQRVLELAEYHKRISELYKRAASRPWLNVADATPPPATPEVLPAPPAAPVDDGYRLEWPLR